MPTVVEPTDETGRGPRRRPDAAGTAAAPATPWSAQAVLVRTNAQAAVDRRGVHGAAAIPHRVRGAGDPARAAGGAPGARALLRVCALRSRWASSRPRCERAAPRRAGRRPGTASRDGSTAGPRCPAAPRSSPRSAGPTSPSWSASAASTSRSIPHGGVPGASSAGSPRRCAARTPPAGDAVEIVTFHAAKGLEWSMVHLAGLEKGFVPIHHAEDRPRRPRGGTPAPLRRAHPRTRRAALHLGGIAHLRLAHRQALAVAVAAASSSRRVGHRADPGSSAAPRRRPRAGAARATSPCKATGHRRCRPSRCSRPCGRGGERRPRRPTSPAFVIFNDATLHRGRRSAGPRTRAELLRGLRDRRGQGRTLRRRPAPPRGR